MKKLSEYPTPETDEEIEQNRGNIPKYGWIDPRTSRDLEQRLAACRETLRLAQCDDKTMLDANVWIALRKTLALTAPK